MDANELLKLPDDAFVSREAAAGVTGGQSRWTLSRWSATGKFPPSVVIGGTVLYRVRDLRAWLSDPLGWVARNKHQAEESLV